MVHAPVSMLFPPIDPNERFRSRRAAARRRKRLRRSAAVSAVLLGVVLLGAGAQFVGTGSAPPDATESGIVTPAAAPSSPRALPVEIRGVHVTMGLASLPGKLDEYFDLQRDGLTALELDVKDENGQIGFVSRRTLASKVGATRDFFAPRAVAQLASERGVYLIGRIVVFEDPILSAARPDLAIRWSDGSVWRDSAGLGWTNPYDRRVWDYNVDVAVAAARAGFDEIMFDYVRFPSDGDVESAVYRNRGTLTKRDAIPAFLRYAARRLDRYDVRVSAAVFGLAAARDLGIGQLPKRMAPHLDTLYAMTYPSLFGPGELGIADPSAAPGETVSRALRKFAITVRGSNVLVVPWVQDFSFTTPFELEQVRAQIDAARRAGAKGFMLWNAEGVYTDGALAAS